MVDHVKAAALYEEAYLLAADTPEIGGKLAGNCTTVYYGLLCRARTVFGSAVELAIGHIELGGKEYFNFSDEEARAWRSGSVRMRYNLHAWLVLEADLIDLTLAPTLYEIAPHLLSPGLTYLDSTSAKRHGINHVAHVKGDNVLFDHGLLRK